MDEIEIKVINEDYSQIRKKLISLGAKKISFGHLHTYYLDTPDLKFAREKKVLRLRFGADKSYAMLGYKSTKEDSKISVYDEKEVKVENPKVALEIFLSSGFIIADELEKTREKYVFENSEIVFDKLLGKYSFVPEYLEIESKSKIELNKLVEKLGISKTNLKPINSHELIALYSKK